MTELDKEAIYAKTMRVGIGSAIDDDGVRDVLAFGFELATGGVVRVVLDATRERLDALIRALEDIRGYTDTGVPPPGAYWE